MTSQFEYVDEAAIDPDLTCAICCQTLQEPRSTPCGDIFCRSCITQWLQTSRDRSCPLCRKTLSVDVLIEPPRAIRNLLAQIPVKCLLCQQTNIRRGDFDDHLRSRCAKKSTSAVKSTTRPRTPFIAVARSQTASRDRQETAKRAILVLFLIMLLVIFFSPVRAKHPSKGITVELDHQAIAMPITCPKSDQCLEARFPFENSRLLTCEQQNCLNYFYSNRTQSGMAGWKLIYRGSHHGFSSKAFHSRCDDQGETFTVLRSSYGHLFGGFTDASWTTPDNHLPCYNTSERSFLFSLASPQDNTLPTKFTLDSRYREYSIVNDPSSGPIFGGMSRPDLGVYPSDKRFRCQIHFPIAYTSAVAVSSFPSSTDCVIDDIEVFIPEFEFAHTFVSAVKTLMSFITGGLACLALWLAWHLYKERHVREGHVLLVLFLLFTGMHYYFK